MPSCLIFLQSFSGCDTVSAISGFSKPTLLSKLCKTDKSEQAMDVFSDIRAKKSDIIKAAYELFKIIYRFHLKIWKTEDLISSASGPQLGASSLRNCLQLQELKHSTLCGHISRPEIGYCYKVHHWTSLSMDGNKENKVMHQSLQQIPSHRTTF
jgi:hypothetical protein